MNEITRTKSIAVQPDAFEAELPERNAREIRVLDDFELVLAGGGDAVERGAARGLSPIACNSLRLPSASAQRAFAT